MNLFCLGFGFSAAEFVRRHRASFASVAATARSASKAEAILARGVDAVPLDAAPALFIGAARAADVILVSAAPGESGDPFVARLRAALGGEGAGKRVLYLSTVGVYGDRAGGWVSEEDEPCPSSPRSRARLAAEREWLAFGAESGAETHLLRLSGIYGPGRSAIDSLRSGTARRLMKPGQVFNRIHVADIAGACRRMLDYRGPRRVWNVTDDEPAPPQDVIVYAAEVLGVDPPQEQAFDPASLSPMAASFYSENKRVANRALRRELGLELLYPTYREGLAAIASGDQAA